MGPESASRRKRSRQRRYWMGDQAIAETCRYLTAHPGAGDQELAAHLGISRQQAGNYRRKATISTLI